MYVRARMCVRVCVHVYLHVSPWLHSNLMIAKKKKHLQQQKQTFLLFDKRFLYK